MQYHTGTSTCMKALVSSIHISVHDIHEYNTYMGTLQIPVLHAVTCPFIPSILSVLSILFAPAKLWAPRSVGWPAEQDPGVGWSMEIRTACKALRCCNLSHVLVWFRQARQPGACASWNNGGKRTASCLHVSLLHCFPNFEPSLHTSPKSGGPSKAFSRFFEACTQWKRLYEPFPPSFYLNMIVWVYIYIYIHVVSQSLQLSSSDCFRRSTGEQNTLKQNSVGHIESAGVKWAKWKVFCFRSPPSTGYIFKKEIMMWWGLNVFPCLPSLQKGPHRSPALSHQWGKLHEGQVLRVAVSPYDLAKTF